MNNTRHKVILPAAENAVYTVRCKLIIERCGVNVR
jgi:hypothetical protein